MDVMNLLSIFIQQKFYESVGRPSLLVKKD